MRSIIIKILLSFLVITSAYASATFECSFSDGLKLHGIASYEERTPPTITSIELKNKKNISVGEILVGDYIEHAEGLIVQFTFKALGMNFVFRDGELSRNRRASYGECLIE